MSPTPPTPEALAALTVRLLDGTGIDPADVAAVASGDQSVDGPIAAALRDGWDSAEGFRP